MNAMIHEDSRCSSTVDVLQKIDEMTRSKARHNDSLEGQMTTNPSSFLFLHRRKRVTHVVSIALEGFLGFVESIKIGITITVGFFCLTIVENFDAHRSTGGRKELVEQNVCSHHASNNDIVSYLNNIVFFDGIRHAAHLHSILSIAIRFR